MNHDMTTQINLHNVAGWRLDADMRRAVMAKVCQYLDSAALIDIYPQRRVPDDAPAYQSPGRLEWTINIRYHGATTQVFTLAALQRTKDAVVEFHS
jgi:hypothetical protein